MTGRLHLLQRTTRAVASSTTAGSFLSLRRTPNSAARCLNGRMLDSCYSAASSYTRYFSDKTGNRPQDGIPEGVEFEEVVDSKLLQVDPSLFTEEIKIRMPDMGNGDGRVLKWYKEVGDVVQREDVLCDIETPDFTFGMEIDDEELGIIGTYVLPYTCPFAPCSHSNSLLTTCREYSCGSRVRSHKRSRSYLYYSAHGTTGKERPRCYEGQARDERGMIDYSSSFLPSPSRVESPYFINGKSIYYYNVTVIRKEYLNAISISTSTPLDCDNS
jgi:hypothetical protein